MSDYILNIEFLTDLIADQYDITQIRAIFARYGATCIDNLPASRLSEVFADMYQLLAES